MCPSSNGPRKSRFMSDIATSNSPATTEALGTPLEQHLDLLRQGIVAARANDKVKARSLLREAIAIQNDQEVTWMWLASVAESSGEVRGCMEKVLEINPGNEKATDWIRKSDALKKPIPPAKNQNPAVNQSSAVNQSPAVSQSPAAVSETPVSSVRKARLDTRPIPPNWRDSEEKDESVEGTVEMERAKVILAVDDSPTVRKLVAVTLERQGYRVVSAADGMQALAKLQDVIPDLILLDIAMPHLDGYQICKVIKANDLTCDVPVVMLSGKDGFFDKVRGRMAGAVDYVTKPFDPQALLRILEKNLEARDA